MAQATLNGTIVEDGGLSCEYRFNYGETPALGTTTPWKGGWLASGETFFETVRGLKGNTIYYFRAEARNSLGTVTGSPLNFITTKAPDEMSVGVMEAINITESAARIRGMVLNSVGQYGRVRFHWGATASYGNITPWQHGFATGGEFYADISGLSPETAYHYKAELHASPSVFSADATFWTLAEVGGMVLLDDNLLQILEGK